MRLLLDECVPRRLGRELSDHEVRTVPEMGWAAKKNGELVQLASDRLPAPCYWSATKDGYGP